MIESLVSSELDVCSKTVRVKSNQRFRIGCTVPFDSSPNRLSLGFVNEFCKLLISAVVNMQTGINIIWLEISCDVRDLIFEHEAEEGSRTHGGHNSLVKLLYNMQNGK